MKRKVVLGLTLMVAAVLFTGCTPKESALTCTQTTSGVDIEFNVAFKGNTIDTMDFNYDMDVSKYSSSQIALLEKKDFCKIVKNSMADFKDAFSDCSQKVEDKHLKVSSALDIDKIAKSYLDKMTSPKTAKSQLEASGFKCTLK